MTIADSPSIFVIDILLSACRKHALLSKRTFCFLYLDITKHYSLFVIQKLYGMKIDQFNKELKRIIGICAAGSNSIYMAV